MVKKMKIDNGWVTETSVDECLFMIQALGADYDGLDGSVEGLKYLVCELVNLASDATKFLYEGRLWAKDSLAGTRPDNWKEVFE